MMMMYYLLPFQVNYVALITLYRRNKRKATIWLLGFESSNVTWILVLILDQLNGFRSHKKEI